MSCLDTGFDFDLFVAFQCRHGDDASQHGRHNVELGTYQHVVSATCEYMIGFYANSDVEVAGLCAELAYVALSLA